ncbi:MAG: COG4223 family protein [Roseobacter sp.]
MAKSKKPDTQADTEGQQIDSVKKDAIDVEFEALDPVDSTLDVHDDPAHKPTDAEAPDGADSGTLVDEGLEAKNLPDGEQPDQADSDGTKEIADTSELDGPLEETAPDNVSDAPLDDDHRDAQDPDKALGEMADKHDEDVDLDDLTDRDQTPSDNADTKPAAEPVAAAPVAAEPQKSGFMPLFFGGVVAAVIGFLAGQGGMLEGVLPESFKAEVVDLAPLQAQLDEQTALNATLEAQIAELSALVAEAATVESALPAEFGELETAVQTLTGRLDAIETSPQAPAVPDDLATTDDVAELQSALQAQSSELEALAERARLAEENATLEAQKVLARAALSQLNASVETGGTYADAIAALEDVTPVEVPQALRDAAETGVITLAELQGSFPDAARSALAASRAEIPESEVEGVTGFIRRQLSVRSVVPREGDGADAVLSRAEAAVRGGSLSEALTELDALPDTARAAMQDWLDQAQTRNAVQQAAADLAGSLASN